MTASLQSLHVFLAKTAVTDHAVALRDRGVGLRKLPIDATRRISGTLYVKAARPEAPTWVQFIEELFKSSPLASLRNSGASGALLITVDKRLFAITFGHGRHLLEPGQFVRDYGLRVTLNAVDESKLRSVDLMTHEELTLQTRRQASRATTLPTFGIDKWRDFLRGVTGEPRDQVFASRLTGNEGLTLTAKLEVTDIPDKLRTTLTLLDGKTYQTHFGWIDDVQIIRDQPTIDHLDALLLSEIENFDPNRLGTLYMAPPESHDWEDAEHFRFQAEPEDARHDELELGDYLDSIARRRSRRAITVEHLHKDKVIVSFAGSGARLPRWSVYDCLIFEVVEGERRFVLSGGDWFEVAATYVEEIRGRLAAVPISELDFPRCGANEEERDYNVRAREAIEKRHGIAVSLFDRKILTPQGASSGIEVCDLMTERGEFIHVKKRTKSATLSHLFAQGHVAGQVFLRDPAFRGRMRTVAGIDPKVAALISAGPERPDSRSYEVVYAVVARGFSNPDRALPFLSQVSLCAAVDDLHDLGYRVALAKVDCL